MKRLAEVGLQSSNIRLLGIREVATLAGVSTRTIRRYSNAGLLPRPIRLAGKTLWKWRFRDIEAWINEQAIDN